MDDLNKRLVEVEYILKKLDDEYIEKIPQEIWDYIEENKDKEYIFNYNQSKALAEQNLNINTIAILTYINMEYLLNEEQKKEMMDLLKKDELIAEHEKSKKYNLNYIFKNNKSNIKNAKQNETLLVEVKTEKWYEKVFSFLKKVFIK